MGRYCIVISFYFFIPERKPLALAPGPSPRIALLMSTETAFRTPMMEALIVRRLRFEASRAAANSEVAQDSQANDGGRPMEADSGNGEVAQNLQPQPDDGGRPVEAETDGSNGEVAQDSQPLPNGGDRPMEATTSGDQALCAVCIQPLDDGTQKTRLMCCHTFHAYCIEQVMEVGQKSMDTLPCPVCKLTAEEGEHRRRQLMGSSVEIIDVEEHAANHATRPAASQPKTPAPLAGEPKASTATCPAAPQPTGYSLLAGVLNANTAACPAAPKPKGPPLLAGGPKAPPPALAALLGPKPSMMPPPPPVKGTTAAPTTKHATQTAAPKQDTQKAAPTSKFASPFPNLGNATTSQALVCVSAEPAELALGGPVARTHPHFLETGTVYCSDCGSELDLINTPGVRIVSKRSNSWRCPKCATKVTQLNRCFGSWPTQAYVQLPKEEKLYFMKQLQSKYSQQEVSAYCRETLNMHEQHEDYYREGGEFLPLSVWEKQGWDIAKIEAEALPGDRKEVRMAGTCYRVPVYSAGKRGRKGHSKQDTASGETTLESLKVMLERMENPSSSSKGPQAPAEEGDECKDADSYSTSSSSSSSTHDKKKKKKKNKSKRRGAKRTKTEKQRVAEETKAAAAKEKEEKRLAFQNARVTNGLTKLAEATGKLVDPVLLLVESCMRNPRYLDLPATAQRSAMDTREMLTRIMTDVSKIKSGNFNSGLVDIPDVKAAKKMVSEHKKKIDIVVRMLAMATQLGV